MRVTIKHRESKPNYFVDCAVEFSKAEHKIISERGLEGHVATATGIRTESAAAGMGTGCLAWVLRIIGGLLVFSGLLAWLAGSVSGQGSVGVLLLILGIGAVIGSFFFGMQSEIIEEQADLKGDRLTIGDILQREGKFSLLARNPAEAKILEAGLREDLALMKTILSGSADLGTTKTYEL